MSRNEEKKSQRAKVRGGGPGGRRLILGFNSV